MNHSREPGQVRLRALLLTTATLAALGALGAGLRAALGLAGSAAFEDLLVGWCLVAALVAATWLALTVLAAALPILVRGRLPGRGRGPRRVGVVVAAVCGLGLTAAPALAQESRPDLTGIGTTARVLHGLPLPGRPVAAPPPAPQRRTHVVRPGESLWSIAAADLGPRAGVGAIDAHWRAVYAANRAAIGDDPDLIGVGTVLRLPAR